MTLRDYSKALTFVLFSLLFLMVACSAGGDEFEEAIQPGQAPAFSNESQEETVSDIVGQVESITRQSWMIDGQFVNVDDSTEIDDDIELGDMVRVRAEMGDDGLMAANEIQLVQANLDDDINENDDDLIGNDDDDDLNDNDDDDDLNDNDDDDDLNDNDDDDDLNGNDDDDDLNG
ncbi:MAG: DUF5666 domain-containing protein, partial [Chloroflexota bacterium]